MMDIGATAINAVTTPIDYVLDRVTMYRLALYVLVGMLGVAMALAAFGLLPFSPLALIASVGWLCLLCWAGNTLFAWLFRVPTNVESSVITALILALILDPATSVNGFQFLGWAALLAMASKYILALGNKHIFNPAAIAAVITAFALNEPASWWVGTRVMAPVALIGGLLIVRKMREEAMVGCFVAAALVATSALSLFAGHSAAHSLSLLLLDSPLFFVAGVMLTEPLTSPTTKTWRLLYAVIVGALYAPQAHIGSIYSTPELALVVGNIFAYLVSSPQRVVLRLKTKKRVARDTIEFIFAPSRRMTYQPGQYLEVTLAHAPADARGNRRFFTFASAPTEDTVRLGVRFYPQGSTFKQALNALDGRTPVLGGQVAGDFTLPGDPSEKLLFIAGGIGITPYRSMLKYLLDTQQRRDIVVIYATRAAEDIAYRDVLSDAEAKAGATIVYTVTDPGSAPRGWSGSTGRVDEALIRAAAPDFAERTCYVSGPPDMVRAAKHSLRRLGVRRGRIKTDFFPGLV